MAQWASGKVGFFVVDIYLFILPHPQLIVTTTSIDSLAQKKTEQGIISLEDNLTLLSESSWIITLRYGLIWGSLSGNNHAKPWKNWEGKKSVPECSLHTFPLPRSPLRTGCFLRGSRKNTGLKSLHFTQGSWIATGWNAYSFFKTTPGW